LSSVAVAFAPSVPFFVVDVGTLARYRTMAPFQVRGCQAGRTTTPRSAM
jgi:hypothetical protein